MDDWCIKWKCEIIKHGIKQYEIADEIGYTPEHVSGIMNGRIGSRLGRTKIEIAVNGS